MQHDEMTPSPPVARHRRMILGALAALVAASRDAQAQMGGGPPGGGGMGGGGGPGSGGHDKPQKECPKGESPMPRDLMAAFAQKLQESAPDLGLQPAQLPAYQDVVTSAVEVGRHNERWLAKALAQASHTVSAAEPVGAFIGSELGDGDDRQQALQDLQARYATLRQVLDERQRQALSSIFATTRADLRAASAR